ncbi:MAG TPA: diacylglycerol kinase family protein [Bacteroidota bacterium]|nr:diacylglycerol kinase family protein [Bacteroidota bacterium]
MKQHTFIVNPNAGRGTGKKVFESLRVELARRAVEFDHVETKGPGDATVVARTAQTPIIVAVGGDGTVNEVANGLAGSQKTLGIVPAGSGDDFIKSVGISRKPLEALATVFGGIPRAVDLGRVTCSVNADGSLAQVPRYFVNGIGAGFDAAVASRTQEIQFLGGTAVYVLAVLQTLGHYTPPEFTLTLSGTVSHFKGLLIAIGNGVCAGGGFYLTPDAIVDDGVLDICTVQEKTIFQILRLMPLVMKGKHHDVEGVKFYRDNKFTISAQEPFYVHADGEIVGRDVRHVAIDLLPGHLTVLVNPAGST